jgi:hypothetical protein
MTFKFQLENWSTTLNLDINDLAEWFRIKWRAKLEYEAAMSKQVENIFFFFSVKTNCSFWSLLSVIIYSNTVVANGKLVELIKQIIFIVMVIK